MNVSAKRVTKKTDEGEPSIQELEFSLKHDANDLLNKSDIDALSIKDINLIKLILCSGLYPNMSISDEANYEAYLGKYIV